MQVNESVANVKKTLGHVQCLKNIIYLFTLWGQLQVYCHLRQELLGEDGKVAVEGVNNRAIV